MRSGKVGVGEQRVQQRLQLLADYPRRHTAGLYAEKSTIQQGVAGSGAQPHPSSADTSIHWQSRQC